MRWNLPIIFIYTYTTYLIVNYFIEVNKGAKIISQEFTVHDWYNNAISTWTYVFIYVQVKTLDVSDEFSAFNLFIYFLPLKLKKFFFYFPKCPRGKIYLYVEKCAFLDPIYFVFFFAELSFQFDFQFDFEIYSWLVTRRGCI